MGSLDRFFGFLQINYNRHPKVPIAVNQFTYTGKGARYSGVKDLP